MKIIVYAVWFIISKIALGLLLLLMACLLYALFVLFVVKVPYKQKQLSLENLRKGDVILTGKKQKTYSWHIKLSNVLTNGIDSQFWTHAALYVGNGQLIEAQPSGLRKCELKEYFDENFLVKALRHKYIDDNAAEWEEIVSFSERTKNDADYKYGYVGLFFYVLATFIPVSMNFIFKNKLIDKLCNLDKAYFCSELVADCFKEAGIPVSQYDSWRIKPSDFEKNPFFKEI